MKLSAGESISAEVILFGASGKSLHRSTEPITSENIEDFLPSAENINKATEVLVSLGFDVQVADTSLTITASSNVFETTFNIKIQVDDSNKLSVVGVPNIPELLKPFVDTIVFATDYDYF